MNIFSYKIRYLFQDNSNLHNNQISIEIMNSVQTKIDNEIINSKSGLNSSSLEATLTKERSNALAEV